MRIIHCLSGRRKTGMVAAVAEALGGDLFVGEHGPECRDTS